MGRSANHLAQTMDGQPYVAHVANVAGGKAIIVGTRIKVTQIALEYERLGWTPDQIIDAHPHLTLAQVHAALAYYYEHQAELDAEIASERRMVDELQTLYPSKLSRD